MNERVETILQHMLEDAGDAIAFAKEVGSFEIFSQDMKTRKAVIMSLLNIGELASQLSSEYKASHSEIPWKNMIGMRNYAAHGYHTMNLDTVWATTQTALPMLLTFLKTQLHLDIQNEDNIID
jgi:uncharacterized protein with HEPN domain